MVERETYSIMSVVGCFVIMIGIIVSIDVWLFEIILINLAINWIYALPPIIVALGINMMLIFGLMSWMFGD